MSEQQQHIIDIHNMSCILNVRQLKIIKELEEKMIDALLLSLAPDAILENMDITEKLMLIRELSKDKETLNFEKEESIPIEEFLKEMGLNADDI